MNKETKDLIKRWTEQGSKQEDPFIKFFIFYMCLDAWITSESQCDTDTNKLEWLIHEDNYLKTHWDDTPNKRDALNGLKEVRYVENMRPGSQRGDRSELTDITDFEQVIKFIYQIRCNLFHGGKSPDRTNDKELVRLASEVLENWIKYSLSKT